MYLRNAPNLDWAQVLLYQLAGVLMKLNLMTLTYIFFMTFIMVSTTMAATPEVQQYDLKYLSEVSHGELVHSLKIKATSFEHALQVSRKQCVRDLMDKRLSDQDIADLCNNPRL
jgi:hypothetical protein